MGMLLILNDTTLSSYIILTKACEACTFFNTNNDGKCEICGTKAPLIDEGKVSPSPFFFPPPPPHAQKTTECLPEAKKDEEQKADQKAPPEESKTSTNKQESLLLGGDFKSPTEGSS